MITRTCTTTKINAKVYNEVNDAVEQIEKEIIGKHDEFSARKSLAKMGYNVLKINSLEQTTELRAMDEQTYLEHSYVIPDRKKKDK